MNLRDCYRQACSEFIAAGDKFTPQDVLDRAMELNGARTEFTAAAERNAQAQARREIKSLLREYADEADDDHETPMVLFLLPKKPTRIVTMPDPDHPGEYLYKAYTAATDADLLADIEVKQENVHRATRRLFAAKENRRALAPWFTSSVCTVREALERMSRERAA